eukprot:jgi/Hompol1/1781/HPOL_002758-RA
MTAASASANDSQPIEIDYQAFLTAKAKLRTPDAIRELYPLIFIPGMISLGGGLPHPDTYPFKSLSYTLESGEVVQLSTSELNASLQYSATPGMPGLVKWLHNLQVHEHGRKPDSFDVCVGVGGQDMLTKVFGALVSEGDSVIVEAPAYTGVMAFLRPLRVNFVEMLVDQHGINPAVLETTLSNWADPATRPRVLYTVPVSGNPTGVSTTLERKRQIYAIARKYNLLILEDDPYYYLQFDERTPSYFALDVDGRVLRFDSFSKIVSAGARIGWLSGPKAIVDIVILDAMCSNLQASGVSQGLIHSLLSKWGIEGFYKHCAGVALFYKAKRDAFVESSQRHLDGIAEFVVPATGMFVWLNLIGIEDTNELVRTRAVGKKVLFVPGCEFFPIRRKSSYVRASYSLASVEEIDIALQRLRGLPHPSSFPFKSLQYSLQNGEVVEVPAEQLKEGLQYSATPGIPSLVNWLRNLQSHEHGRKADSFDVCVGVGSQDLLTKAFDALINEGDHMLIEAPAYVGVLAYLRPLGAKFVEVEIDQDGLNPAAMEQALANWRDPATRPKVLYTVPTAGNPTGSSTTFERKKQIYDIARKYNIIIIEDDPYYYLQFDKRTPSYFSFDTDGRVLRSDSFSKVLSAGARLGWMSGPKQLIDMVVLHGMASNLHPSGISQIVIGSLLEKWGIEGFNRHCDGVSAFYKTKLDAFLESARRHLDGIAEFVVPTAGMFVWLKLIGVEDTMDLIKRKALDKKVLLVPGGEFLPNTRPTPYVRASYSLASEKDMDTALQRLRDLVLEARAEAKKH